jgi:hypothetical protein
VQGRDVYSGGAPFSIHIAGKAAHYFRAEKDIEDENEKLTPRENDVSLSYHGGARPDLRETHLHQALCPE